MKELTWYYVSRAAIALAAATVSWSATHSIWLTVVTGLVAMAGFVWYARSNHFIVDPGRPLAPLGRDEREQAITYQAATYAFVAVMLLLGLLGFLSLPGDRWHSVVIVTGFTVYLVARTWLRRVR